MADPNPPPQTIKTPICTAAVPAGTKSKFKLKAARRRQTRLEKYTASMNDNSIINMYINKAEDERTVIVTITSRTCVESLSMQDTPHWAKQRPTFCRKEGMQDNH